MCFSRNFVQGQESRTMTWVDLVVRSADSTSVARIASTAGGANPLANGDMEQADSNTHSTAGRSAWFWVSEAQIGCTIPVGYRADPDFDRYEVCDRPRTVERISGSDLLIQLQDGMELWDMPANNRNGPFQSVV